MTILESNSKVGWDLPIRIIHWTVAGCFAANYFYTESGGIVHERIGIAIIVLIVLRLLWGATRASGPNRLGALKISPRGIREHIGELRTRKRQENVGHNPAGVLAVWALWIGLIAAGASGKFATTDIGIDLGAERVHMLIVDAVAALVCIHIAAVVLMSWWARCDLVFAMVIGRFPKKRPPS